MDKNNIDISFANKVKQLGNSVTSGADAEIAEYITSNKDQIVTLINRLEDRDRVLEMEELSKKINDNKSVNIQTLSRKIEQKRGTEKIRRRLLVLVTSVAAAVIAVSLLVYNYEKKDSASYVAEQSVDYNISEPTLFTTKGDVLSLNDSDINTLNESDKTINLAKLFQSSRPSAKSDKIEYNQIIVPSMHNKQVRLPDGSIVTINANSSLRYNNDFSYNNRIVELDGEAYFEVVKSDKPFIIKTKLGDVKVYGTQFNVDTNNKSSFKTVLVNGSVGVKIKGAKEIMIKPSEMICVNNKGEHHVEVVDVSKHLLWRGKAFDFVGIPIETAILTLERWYGVKINLPKQLIDLKINIYVDKSLPFGETVTFIERLYNVKFIREDANEYSLIR